MRKIFSQNCLGISTRPSSCMIKLDLVEGRNKKAGGSLYLIDTSIIFCFGSSTIKIILVEYPFLLFLTKSNPIETAVLNLNFLELTASSKLITNIWLD